MLFKRILLQIFLATFLVLASVEGQAQNIQNQMSQIEVDDLSDEQVAKYWEKIKEEGYTLDQALAIAKTRGMSELQAQKLRARIETLKSKPLNKKEENEEELQEEVDSTQLLFGLTGEEEKKEEKKKNSSDMTFLIIQIFRLHQI
nr:hypothetical protein BACY1_18200 [Tenacibaculum mesophilum]